ncbi:MAG: 3-deoxy-7-phosphoheptulonate synthase class II [Pelagibacteraceae bacterium]|nr:3-deoxy-7-phosphoheptulonate synthase class II [Pelagibacteraceae bacterium]|tara:strand:- start:2538 stop:3890 length:1353 start_codon:yes stop_codon:yes gene_type:complete
MNWKVNSWKSYVGKQMPTYNDKEKLNKVTEELSKYPPLIFAGETRSLKKKIAEVQQGNAFYLQGGDCAESFQEFNPNTIRDTFKLLLQMSVVLTYATNSPVVKLGRIAGQFAKPRSSDIEEKNGEKLPSYRGDIINSYEFSKESRDPDPSRMITAYNHSASTLNLLRAFAQGGFASLTQLSKWNLDFAENFESMKKYSEISKKIQESIKFMNACGINETNTRELRETDFYTSHEALLLPYEEAFTRIDSTTGDWYNVSSHFLWVGDRTRDPDGAHIHYLSGIKNPLGLKVGPSTNIDELKKNIDILNPENEEGRLTLIVRMGAEKIKEAFPNLLKETNSLGKNLTWICDPMHGNTVSSNSGYKTRNTSNVLSEIKNFFEIHKSQGTIAGGVHLELTGLNVTECVGGPEDIKDENLGDRYHTFCDPRLNVNQSLELCFLLADLFSNGNLSR